MTEPWFDGNNASLIVSQVIEIPAKRKGDARYLALDGKNVEHLPVAGTGSDFSMRFYPTAMLAMVTAAALIEPAFAGQPTPGPIAGLGLPALAIAGGVYWVGRKLLKRD